MAVTKKSLITNSDSTKPTTKSVKPAAPLAPSAMVPAFRIALSKPKFSASKPKIAPMMRF